jgi:hypothetical protein
LSTRSSGGRGCAATGDAALAAALRLATDPLDAAVAEFVPVAIAESHVAAARLTGELTRATFQLRIFAELLGDGGTQGCDRPSRGSVVGYGPAAGLVFQR